MTIIGQDTPYFSTGENKTYTVEEIATQLNISLKSAYALARTGEFRSVRVGRMIRVSRESFDEWLNQSS